MLVKELFLETRYHVDDLQSTKYNNYQLITCLNIALESVNKALCRVNSRLVKVKSPIVLDFNLSTTLPSDFNGLINIFSNADEVADYDYMLIGNVLTFSPSANATDILYNKSFPTIVSEDDVLPVPKSFSTLLNKAILALITKSIPFLQVYQEILTDVSLLPELNEHAFIERDMPFTL